VRSSAFVSCLLPESEYEWLLSQGLTAGVAIAELRELRDNPPAQSVGFVLSAEAMSALMAIRTANILRTGTERTLLDQLETIIIARAEQMGVTK
jgi:hypothetical protein